MKKVTQIFNIIICLLLSILLITSNITFNNILVLAEDETSLQEETTEIVNTDEKEKEDVDYTLYTSQDRYLNYFYIIKRLNS